MRDALLHEERAADVVRAGAARARPDRRASMRRAGRGRSPRRVSAPRCSAASSGRRTTGASASGPSRSQGPETRAFRRQGVSRSRCAARARASATRAAAASVVTASTVRSAACATETRASAELDVDAVQQRSREPSEVAADRHRRADAGAAADAVVAAGARVGGQDELEARRGRMPRRPARWMVIVPVSSGWRSASSALGGNSPASSRNRMPSVARAIAPGRSTRDPPPTSAATLALWCGASNGGAPGERAHRVAREGSDRRDLQRRGVVEGGEDPRAAGGRASSCPHPAARTSAGDGRPRRRR